MGEASDDILTQPLGVAKAATPSRFAALRVPTRIAAGIGGVVLAGLGAVLVLFGDPQGGEPRSVAQITIREPAPAASTPKAAEVMVQPDASEQPRRSSALEVEQASGVTVTRASGASAPEAPVIIHVPSAEIPRLAAAPDPRLIERGRHGMLPRIGEGRLRALDVYARPDVPNGAKARIAIIVAGVGIGEAATAAAITKLPSGISLALAPYGAEADKNAARIRNAGHELLLQVPMEPFDYPDSDPGPQTLLTSSRPPENLDRLAWAMSRFSGFVGIVNFMGAKLTSDAAALEPVLREVGARGLGFVDDGVSPRSLAATLAAKVKTPTTRAEIVLDAVPRPEAIDRELARLEAQARQKGFVIASASALPMTIDRIARWSRDLDARGIRLVPISTALRAMQPGTRLSSAER